MNARHTDSQKSNKGRCMGCAFVNWNSRMCKNIVSSVLTYGRQGLFRFSLRRQPVSTALVGASSAPDCRSFHDKRRALRIAPMPNRTILSWERPLQSPHRSVSIRRGTSEQLHEARLVDSPIFCLENRERQTVEYHCFDTIALASGMTYYWLIEEAMYTGKIQGPFVLQSHALDEFAQV